MVFDQQYKDQKHILKSRDKQLQSNANVKYDTIQPGMLVADHYLPGKTASTTSRELRPAISTSYRVITSDPTRSRVCGIINGEERTIPNCHLRIMKMTDLIHIKFSLKNKYIKSHFNRLAKNNKFLGPDQTKTWRSLLNMDSPGTNLSLPTCTPEPDLPAPIGAAINQSDSSLPDGQILPRQTISGRLYFAGIQNTEELISVNKIVNNKSVHILMLIVSLT